MKPAISVNGLSKRYRLGTGSKNSLQSTFRESITDAVRARWQRLRGLYRRNNGTTSPSATERPGGDSDELWALRDVSFSVQPGEVMGIIGRNGAGKSTLLKVLSRITAPTTGRVEMRGRVGSLLEVGTGFHPELTGRENIYLNGSILGMSRREITRKFDDIVSFAEVEKFLDTPVKRYSSGMYVRLAFAVAAHLSSDVLFVDEVLAVGDTAFQKKCLGAMRELGNGGRTVLFVTHNMAAVENLCKRTIWIAGGQLKQDGNTREVIRDYLNSYDAAGQQTLDLSAVRERTGTGDARLLKMEFLKDGNEKISICSGDPLRIRLHYECYRDIPNLYFGIRIFSNMGVLLSDIHNWTTNQAVPLARKGKGSIDLVIDSLNLMPGTYYAGLWASSIHQWHDVLENVAKIDIEPSDFYGTGRGVESRFGLVFFPFHWEIPEDNSKDQAAVPIATDHSDQANLFQRGNP